MGCGGGDEETKSRLEGVVRCASLSELPGNLKGFKSEFTRSPRGKPVGC